MKPRERIVTTCTCGTTYDTHQQEDGACPDCQYLRYSEYFSHNLYEDRSKATQSAIKALVYGVIILLISFPVFASSEVNLKVLAMVESSGNALAVGDSGRALGLYQLHKGAVMDVNSILKTNYSHNDALDPEKAMVIADTYVNRVIPKYLRHYWIEDTLENRLTAYNMGIKAVRKGRVAHEYIKKYELQLKDSYENSMVGDE